MQSHTIHTDDYPNLYTIHDDDDVDVKAYDNDDRKMLTDDVGVDKDLGVDDDDDDECNVLGVAQCVIVGGPKGV